MDNNCAFLVYLKKYQLNLIMNQSKNLEKSMVKKNKQGNNRSNMNLDHVGAALDLMLAGCNRVVCPDFLITRQDPYHAEIGHLDPIALRIYDQKFVDILINIKCNKKTNIPEDLENLSQEYKNQRKQLCQYQGKFNKHIL